MKQVKTMGDVQALVDAGIVKIDRRRRSSGGVRANHLEGVRLFGEAHPASDPRSVVKFWGHEDVYLPMFVDEVLTCADLTPHQRQQVSSVLSESDL